MLGNAVSGRSYVLREFAPLQARHRRWLLHQERYASLIPGTDKRDNGWVHELEQARVAKLDRDAPGPGSGRGR